MIEDAALPRKSLETSGSSQKPKMPFRAPSAAVRSASLTASVEGVLDTLYRDPVVSKG